MKNRLLIGMVCLLSVVSDGINQDYKYSEGSLTVYIEIM